MMKSGVGILKILFLSTVSVIVIRGYVLWKQRNKKPTVRVNDIPIPTKWRYIGEVSKINLYPIKFGKHKSLNSALCTEVGLREEKKTGKFSLIDRSFVLFNERTKEILTVRNYPQMLHIEVKALDEDTVVFSSPGFDDFVVKVPTKIKNNTKMVAIFWFKENTFTIDCGGEASTWFTKIFYPKFKIYCRLGYNARGVLPARWIDGSNWSNYAELDNKKDDDFMGSRPDLVSYTVMTHASLNHINSFLDEHVTVYNVFPNILVKHKKKMFEEEWDWLKIDDNIVLRSFKFCTRDLFVPDPEKKELESQASIMGAYMHLHKAGVIKTGAPVYVNCCD